MAQPDAQSNRPTILLTRPAPQSQRFAAEVRHRFGADWPIVISPLMQLQFLDPPKDAAAFAGAIFSSENGVAAVAASGMSAGGPCYCVGSRTAAAAEAAGWRVVMTGADAAGLAQAMLAAGSPGPLVHFHGSHVAGNLAERLDSAKTETVSAVIYDQQPQPPTAEALALLAMPAAVVVPLFSPRSALLFQQIAADIRAPLYLATLSQAVAKALTLTPAGMKIAERPDSDGMLQAIEALLGGIP